MIKVPGLRAMIPEDSLSAVAVYPKDGKVAVAYFGMSKAQLCEFLYQAADAVANQLAQEKVDR